MNSNDGDGEAVPVPITPVRNRQFECVAILDDGRGVSITGDAPDHIVFLVRVTAQLSQIPARVKELVIRDVTGRVIIPGLTAIPPGGRG